jgi:chromosome segregation protein
MKMRLSRLELFGFKSFLHRTVLRFGEGITSIVGPNGCGKSNIVDAIIWALGERGTKPLRVKEMGDVIFHGSNGKGL